jgi:tetratricopeptide (TPR) repeat protein
MKSTMLKHNALAAGLVLATLGAVAWACGPEFPTQMLDDRATSLKAAPQNTFTFEVQHLLPAADAMDAAETPPYGDAPKRPDLPDEQQAKVASLMGSADGAAAYAAGDGLPDDVRQYVAGAVDYNRATASCPPAEQNEYGDATARPPCTTFDASALDAAQASFEKVLALPAEQAKARGAWAAYMLGEAHALRATKAAGTPAFGAERDAAARAFQQVRARVLAGASDAQGLGVASFGEEARLSLFAGKTPCTWSHFAHVDDCTRDIAPADLKHAIALYAAQAGHGSGNAVDSLEAIAAAVLSNDGQAASIIDGPVSQRLLVAYALARIEPQNYKGQPSPVLAPLVEAIMANGADKVASADRLASLAYESGRYDDAEKLVGKAEGPLAAWVRAKLALRKGDGNAATAAYAEAAKAFPAADDPKASLAPGSIHRLMGERGVLALSRGDYIDALTRFYEAARAVGGDGNTYDELSSTGMGYGNDAAYVAERVLTVDELKTFVDDHAKGYSPAPKASDAQASYAGTTIDDHLRYLLARRLMRAGRYDDAYAYLPAAGDKRFGDVDLVAKAKAYAQAVHEGESAWSDITKAEARYQAAVIARENGMELLGYEQGPDYFDNGGLFQGGSGQSAVSLNGEYVTDGERQRFKESAPTVGHRLHYRYVAADRAVSAADLLPPRSQAFAATLCQATHWMLEGPPDYDELRDGDLGHPLNDRQHRVQAYYARYVKEGPYVEWASDFGGSCEEPDFAAARVLKRAQQVRAVKHFVRHWLPLEIGVAVLAMAGLGWAVVRRRRRRIAP